MSQGLATLVAEAFVLLCTQYLMLRSFGVSLEAVWTVNMYVQNDEVCEHNSASMNNQRITSPLSNRHVQLRSVMQTWSFGVPLEAVCPYVLLHTKVDSKHGMFRMTRV